MVRRATRLGRPAEHFQGGFPDGQLADGAPRAALYAALVARRLRSALDDRSLAGVCREAGLARSTAQALLAGDSWPDLVTLAQLEDALGLTLWPSRDDLS